MSKLVRIFLKQRQIVIFSLIFVVIFGIFSYIQIPKQENPNTNFPAAMITTVYPGATSSEVETMVSQKIEDSLQSIQGIETLNSYSVNSASVVVVLFEIDVDAERSLQQVRDLVADVQKDLPPLAMESEVKTDLTDVPQFILSLSNDAYQTDDLVNYAKRIKQSLEQVEEVVRIDIDGVTNKEVLVNVNIDDLYLYKVSIETIVQLLQAQNLTIPSGSISYADETINVKTPATFENLRDIENIIISGSQEQVGFVRLKDVATVTIINENKINYQHNGQNAVLLTGYFEPGTNAVLIGQKVRTILDELKQDLPSDIIFHEVVFSPEDINESINDFILNLAESIALIIIVVMIGVRLRNALIISLSLPISVLITFIVMYLLKIEFHFISIAALIISLGILVDNAIVVSDAIQVHVNQDKPIEVAILAAIKETASPVFTSTLTTIVTFGILLFVPGVIGKTVATIPIVIISTLIASYFVAMLIVPVFAYYFFTKENEKRINKTSNSPIRKFFDDLLALGLKYPKRTLFVSFLSLGVSALLFTQLGISFFPYSDKPILYINLEAETLSIQKTQNVHDQVYAILEEYPEIEEIVTSVGTSLPKFFITVPNSNPGDDKAQFLLKLDLEDSNYASNEEFGFVLQQRLDQSIAGAKLEVKYLEYAMPTDAKLVFTLSGEDIESLLIASNQIKTVLEEIEGTYNIRDNNVPKEYEYVVNIHEDILSTSGILKYDIVKQINTALMGTRPSSFKAGGQEMDILVKGDISSLDDLYRLPIQSSATETTMQLYQLASLDLEANIPSIYRHNGQRTITVLSDIRPGYSAPLIELTFRNKLEELILPDGVSIRFDGELTNIFLLIENLGYSALIAILVIYLILLVQFEKWIKPLIIMTSIPLSLTGVFLGLFLFGSDIQAMALLGAVSLIGIVVNNGILLMEVMDEGLRQGQTLLEACQNAVDARYRPIMLTTITTCIGLIPLIISKDPMTSPMALVLFFGLLVSTILTMVVVPSFYYMIMQDKTKGA